MVFLGCNESVKDFPLISETLVEGVLYYGPLIEDVVSMITKSPLQVCRYHVSTGIVIRRLNQNALYGCSANAVTNLSHTWVCSDGCGISPLLSLVGLL